MVVFLPTNEIWSFQFVYVIISTETSNVYEMMMSTQL